MSSKSVRNQLLDLIKNMDKQRDILRKMLSSLEKFSENMTEIHLSRANLHR